MQTNTSNSQLTVGVGQFAAVNEIEPNKEHIHTLVTQAAAQGVQLLVLPEASMCSFGSPLPQLRETAGNNSPAFIRYMQDLARDHDMHIVVGVLSLADQPGDERVTNQLLVLDNTGAQVLRYTKMHVYDAFKFKESDKVRPGSFGQNNAELGLFDIKGFRVGLINCYDLRFPELARALIDQGADVLSVSAAWLAGPLKENHWEILLRARAIENTSYVLASGQTAPRNCGLSMIVDPLGMVLGTATADPGLAVHTLSSQRIAEVRELLPCLQNRRYQVSGLK